MDFILKISDVLILAIVEFMEFSDLGFKVISFSTELERELADFSVEHRLALALHCQPHVCEFLVLADLECSVPVLPLFDFGLELLTLLHFFRLFFFYFGIHVFIFALPCL